MHTIIVSVFQQQRQRRLRRRRRRSVVVSSGQLVVTWRNAEIEEDAADVISLLRRPTDRRKLSASGTEITPRGCRTGDSIDLVQHLNRIYYVPSCGRAQWH